MSPQDLRSLSQTLDGQPGPSPDSVRFEIADGWHQGRGAFGGLVVGAMVRAAIAAVGDPLRVVRSVTAELLGPVLVGEALLQVDKLRQGAGVSAVRVRLLQANEELCQCVVVFGKDRGNQMPSWNSLPRPSIPDWRGVDVAALAPPLAPVFSQHFDFRVTGSPPMVGASEATAAGFIQPKAGKGPVDGAVVAAMADCWWPAALATFSEPRPAATVTYALEISIDLDTLGDDGPWFHTARADVSSGGYCTEHRQLWTADGRLIAQNQQLFAIIR